jgi:hypothetical protein
MTSPIQVEAFEQIKASSRMALLRLIFRPGGNRRGQTKISKLLVNNHVSVHRVAPLPALPAPGGAERAAFAVPYELLEGDRTFSIELEDGALVELPYPLLNDSTPVVPTGSPAVVPIKDSEASRNAAPAGTDGRERAEQRVVATDTLSPEGAEIDQLHRAYEDAEERLMAETEARATAEVETEALRARVEQLKTEAQEHNRELEGRCAQLERRLTEALAEVEAVTKAERRAVRETRQLKSKLAKQTAQLDELKASPS